MSEQGPVSPENTDRRPDGAAFLIAAGLAAIGAVMLWDASAIPDKGGYSGVGPAAMPRFVGIVLVLLAGLTALSGMRARKSTRPEHDTMPILWIIGGMLAVIFLLNPLGYTIASGILFACTAYGFGKRNFAVTLPVGLGLSFAVYAVFDQVLKLNLPAGILETLVFGG